MSRTDYRIAFEFSKNEISDEDLYLFAQNYSLLKEVKFDKSIFKNNLKYKFSKDNPYDSYSSSNYSFFNILMPKNIIEKVGFSIHKNGSYSKDEFNMIQRVYIYVDREISKKDFEKYIGFFEKLPNYVKISAGSEWDFDDEYDIDYIRPLRVFSRDEVEKYGEDKLMNLKEPTLIKKLKNGSILVWFYLKSYELPYDGLFDFNLSKIREKHETYGAWFKEL